MRTAVAQTQARGGRATGGAVRNADRPGAAKSGKPIVTPRAATIGAQVARLNKWRDQFNPSDGGFLFPSQAEFFDIYQHLDPEVDGQATWPETGPGEPEGANLANPMMAFVFGNPDLSQEDVRLSDRINLLPPTAPDGTPLPPLET